MKINIAVENIAVRITDDEGKVVLNYRATDYHFEADTIGLIKAVEEHIPAIRALVEKIDNA